MNAPVFVDTNVFVYARQRNEHIKQPLAARWIERLWEEQLGRTSIQVLNECYVNLTRKIKPALPPEEAWDDVRLLLSWNPQPMDTDLLLRGREIEQRYRLSWWDSMIVAAAQLQNCATLLTEDLQDRAVYGGVTVHNPFTAGVSEPAATYTLIPQAKPLHRPRGRPRRADRAATPLKS
jgi:predicted nucleic acid-binding protein